MARILVVDDEPHILEVVRAYLVRDGHIVFTAPDGDAALASALAEVPDLIILDVTMPVMDGVTMLSKLKEDPELKTIPVIMLTAESGRENVLQIAKLGVRDYLVKPFKEDQLIEKAGRIVPLAKRPAA